MSAISLNESQKEEVKLLIQQLKTLQEYKVTSESKEDKSFPKDALEVRNVLARIQDFYEKNNGISGGDKNSPLGVEAQYIGGPRYGIAHAASCYTPEVLKGFISQDVPKLIGIYEQSLVEGGRLESVGFLSRRPITQASNGFTYDKTQKNQAKKQAKTHTQGSTSGSRILNNLPWHVKKVILRATQFNTLLDSYDSSEPSNDQKLQEAQACFELVLDGLELFNECDLFGYLGVKKPEKINQLVNLRRSMAHGLHKPDYEKLFENQGHIKQFLSDLQQEKAKEEKETKKSAPATAETPTTEQKTEGGAPTPQLQTPLTIPRPPLNPLTSDSLTIPGAERGSPASYDRNIPPIMAMGRGQLPQYPPVLPPPIPVQTPGVSRGQGGLLPTTGGVIPTYGQPVRAVTLRPLGGYRPISLPPPPRPHPYLRPPRPPETGGGGETPPTNDTGRGGPRFHG